MKHSLLVGVLFCVSGPAWAALQPASVCDPNKDERQFSYNAPVARIVTYGSTGEFEGVCTATLIGRSCMITAGHCNGSLGEVQFNPSVKTCDPDDRYLIDMASVRLGQEKMRRTIDDSPEDWMVFRTKPHASTGKLAGDVYGWYRISNSPPLVSDEVRIAGYGVYDNQFLQMEDKGPLVQIQSSGYGYRVDTSGGTSGSSVVDVRSGEVIAIHTNGGCMAGDSSSYNFGTPIPGNTKLEQAIAECLAGGN